MKIWSLLVCTYRIDTGKFQKFKILINVLLKDRRGYAYMAILFYSRVKLSIAKVLSNYYSKT